MSGHDHKSSYPCPYCRTAPLETTSKAPFVRGFLLAYQIGTKNFVGCVSCVRKKILGEAGLSALVGWFSITALIINPFLIVYNLIQSIFIRERPAKVSKLLNEMGLPENPSQVNITDAGYALAASMIAADGEIEASEIAVAEQLGQNLFPEFDEIEFRRVIGEYKDLPPAVDMAAMLGNYLDMDQKGKVYRYLRSIAEADGNVADEERELLNDISEKMGYKRNQTSA